MSNITKIGAALALVSVLITLTTAVFAEPVETTTAPAPTKAEAEQVTAQVTQAIKLSDQQLDEVVAGLSPSYPSTEYVTGGGGSGSGGGSVD